MKSPSNQAVIAPTRFTGLSLDLSPAPGYSISARGVYVERFLSADGDYVLSAIDSRGRLVARAPISGDASWHEVEQELSAVLDEIDPLRPTLTLVRGCGRA